VIASSIETMNGKEVEIKAEFSESQPTSALLRRW